MEPNNNKKKTIKFSMYWMYDIVIIFLAGRRRGAGRLEKYKNGWKGHHPQNF